MPVTYFKEVGTILSTENEDKDNIHSSAQI